MQVKAIAATAPDAPLERTTIERRDVGEHEVLIHTKFAGICHSDIHTVRSEWGQITYPIVVGHEIAGVVAEVGSGVTKYKVGDHVGVGCFVDSCRECENCAKGLDNYCLKGNIGTYNAIGRDGLPTAGGYSTRIVVDQDYVLRIPDGMPLDAAAPLLCAGITTYSPLRHFGAKPGDRVAVVGLGGLGHMAVKLAAAMGCEVTVLSTHESKRKDATALGAHDFAATGDGSVFQSHAERFDLIIDTVSAQHDYNAYLGLLKADGTMVLLGIPPPSPLSSFPLVWRRRRLAGSLIGGIRETQEMLDFCAEHGIVSDIELIGIDAINEAYERMLKGDVRYRFVIDIASLRAG